MKTGSKRALPRERVGEAEQAARGGRGRSCSSARIDRRPRSRRAARGCGRCHRVDAARGVDQQHGLVGVRGARPGRRHHRPVEPAPRREDAGRVDKDDLRRAFDRDAEQPAARRLRLGRDDRELVADEPVEQRRLAGIGRADQRDIAAAASAAEGGVSATEGRSAGSSSRRVLLCPIDDLGMGREPHARCGTLAWRMISSRIQMRER